MNRKFSALLFVAFVAALLVLSPTAAAHKTAYTADGKYKVVWGFLNEPAITWQKTGIDLRITDNATGAGVAGLQDAIEVHLKKGDHEMHLEDLAGQFGTVGAYTQVVTLTQPGLYTLVIHGKINDTVVDDLEIPAAHEIHEVEDTFFPATDESPFTEGPDAEDDALLARLAALETEVAALKAKQATQSQTPAPLTEQPTTTTAPVPGFGLLAAALAVVGVALVLRRK